MNNNSGFIGLITVMTVSAVAVLITSAVLLRSITESTISFDEEQSAKAWAAVSGCAEYAIAKQATTTGSWDYPGDETLSIGDNSCYILPVDGVGSGTSTPRIIETTSTVNNFVRKVRVEVETNNPNLIVTSWNEVADF